MTGHVRRALSVVALIAVVSAGCNGADTPSDLGAAPTVTTSTVISSSAVTASPSTTTAVPTTSGTAAAPWAAPKLRSDQVPDVLVREWRAGGSRADCAALAPVDLGPAAGGTARRAEFGPGAWAVAWDVPGAPGRLASGAPCGDCGRGAVVVAGTGLEVERPAPTRPSVAVLPNVRRWADGSVARYGLEGGQGPAHLAQLEVAGQACVYNVSSFLGQPHLERLLDSLRFVQGAP